MVYFYSESILGVYGIYEKNFTYLKYVVFSKYLTYSRGKTWQFSYAQMLWQSSITKSNFLLHCYNVFTDSIIKFEENNKA